MREPSLAPQVRNRLHERELRPEDHGLLVRPPSEIPAADASRKAEVVANRRAGRGLPTHAARVDDQRAQSLRSAVHGCRQSGRPASDDHQVEVQALRIDGGAGSPRDVHVTGVGQHRPVRKEQQRQRQGRRSSRGGEQAAAFR